GAEQKRAAGGIWNRRIPAHPAAAKQVSVPALLLAGVAGAGMAAERAGPPAWCRSRWHVIESLDHLGEGGASIRRLFVSPNQASTTSQFSWRSLSASRARMELSVSASMFSQYATNPSLKNKH